MLLAQIAYGTFEQDKLFFSKAEVTRRIAEFLSDTLNAPKHLNSSTVLEAIESHQGLLVERATDTYSFSHLTIQEHLAAHYIVRVSGKELVEKIVSQHILDNRWREVFLLIAGLLGEECQLLLTSLERKAASCIEKDQKFNELFQWVEEITNTEKKCYSTKAMALYIAFGNAVNVVNKKKEQSIDDFEVLGNTGKKKKLEIVEDANSIITAKNSLNGLIEGNFTGSMQDIYNASDAINKAIIVAVYISSFTTTATNTASEIKIKGINAAISAANKIEQANIFDSKNLRKLPLELDSLSKNIPHNNAPESEWGIWKDKLANVWLSSFDLTNDIVSFSWSSVESIANYLYINELIILCKNSAVRVSKKEWEALEARLLTLPESHS